MAKIVETIFIVKASKLITDADTPVDVLSAEVVEQLQEVIQELAGAGAMIEIEHLKSGD